tara:strand:- start:431 stop:1576 length:1146 start_codon:yes stop_codon:yes gene_type:complete
MKRIFFLILKKFLFLLNKYFKIKFTSRNMFGSMGHTIAELDYYFKLVHEYKINKYNIIFLSNKNKMAYESYKLFSKYFFASIISNKLDYILKKFILNEPNDLGLDFGLSTIKHGHESGNYTLEFAFKKYNDYFRLNSKINNFNPFKEIPFSKDLKEFLETEIGNSKYIVIQIKEQKGNSTILKTDPNSYVNFIKFYQQKKYKVIFAGRREKMPHEFKDIGVVDYSKFDNASLQTDLNLISKSELVVSSASGFACLAQVNDVPCVYSNSWHIILTPSSKYCIHLPYLFSRKNLNQLVPYDEIINLYLNKYNQTFLGEDQYDVIPNTGSDILEACKEAMLLKEKYTEPTDIYLNFKNRYDELPIKYCETRISDSFVKKYSKLF